MIARVYDKNIDCIASGADIAILPSGVLELTEHGGDRSYYPAGTWHFADVTEEDA